MAFFGTTNAYLGVDIGTSSLKIAELISRRRRIDVATYAQSNIPNILLNPAGSPEDAVRRPLDGRRRLVGHVRNIVFCCRSVATSCCEHGQGRQQQDRFGCPHAVSPSLVLGSATGNVAVAANVGSTAEAPGAVDADRLCVADAW
jgi:hypothetical protein